MIMAMAGDLMTFLMYPLDLLKLFFCESARDKERCSDVVFVEDIQQNLIPLPAERGVSVLLHMFPFQ